MDYKISVKNKCCAMLQSLHEVSNIIGVNSIADMDVLICTDKICACCKSFGHIGPSAARHQPIVPY